MNRYRGVSILSRMKHDLLVGFGVLLLCPVLQADWLREVEISGEPERDGQVDYTVSILPARTYRYDTIVFECVYHQEFPWEDARGKQYVKIHEPVSFTYRRQDVKLVADLHAYISFRAPISMERLSACYGPAVFRKGVPITIPRMRIVALEGKTQRWAYELNVPGKHNLTKQQENK